MKHWRNIILEEEREHRAKDMETLASGNFDDERFQASINLLKRDITNISYNLVFEDNRSDQVHALFAEKELSLFNELEYYMKQYFDNKKSQSVLDIENLQVSPIEKVKEEYSNKEIDLEIRKRVSEAIKIAQLFYDSIKDLAEVDNSIKDATGIERINNLDQSLESFKEYSKEFFAGKQRY